ncbi:MAG TPA: peptidoglycan editing factor PgeF [Terracidiphilus sp.]
MNNDASEIGALFETAGLARRRRKTDVGVARDSSFQHATPEELELAAPVPTVAPNGIQWLPVTGWQKISWLWHGFSTRRGGVSHAYSTEGSPGELNLGFTPDDDRANTLRNRQLLAEAITGDIDTPLVTLRQIHSSVLVVGETASAGVGGSEHPAKGDGLMTDDPGLLLGIQTADCIPVLIADRKRKAVAAFHAGWRGTVKRIVESGVGRMRMEFGSRPENLVAAIGPGIGPCCYAVGEEVLSEFTSQFNYADELFREVYDSDVIRTKYPMLFLTQRAPGHSKIGPALHLDLIEANRRQLLAAGLKPEAISIVGGCTNTQPGLFFSHRASHGRCGRMMSVIGVRRGNPMRTKPY